MKSDKYTMASIELIEAVDDVINELEHYGTKRHSGRYPWGSGDNPYQHSGDFYLAVKDMKKNGFTEAEIARDLEMSTTELRTFYRIALREKKAEDIARATKLMEKYGSPTEVGRIMGKNESTIRSLVDEGRQAKLSAMESTVNFLESKIKEKGPIDVSLGVERQLGISKEKLKEAETILLAEGYELIKVQVPQATNPDVKTTIECLCPKGMTPSDLKSDMSQIKSLEDYISYDNGETFKKSFVYPASFDSSRLKVHYADEKINGYYGNQKDGVIELRRGVPDISLGDSNYAQVRILVDGTHYLKGMAVYSDNLPDGVDIMFNTNKNSDTPALGPKNHTVLKPIKADDPDNPFGSYIKEHGGQSYYTDENGVERLSVINKRSDEGDWGKWGDHLASQFLAKQNKDLIIKQTNLALEDKQHEFNEIMALENPVIKKKLLQSFADDCDSTAVHLDAAALPRQKYQVLLPLASVKETEVFAPNYEDGEKLVLVRYPHAGTFEIPTLTVNNKIKEGKNTIGLNAKDAIGINSKVAEVLSGADFDGDTVMVIPVSGNGKNAGVHITTREPLKDLKDFDPKTAYPEIPGMKLMSKTNTQREMGEISNLIMDMTLKGASDEDLAKAVKHSMVVIDAEKHRLNYKQSEKDNEISRLHRDYQGVTEEDGRYHEGAGTLITRAKSPVNVDKRVGQPHVNQEGKPWYDPSLPEGAVVQKSVHETYIDKKGKEQVRTTESTKMAETRDARTLSTGNLKEEIYADYANSLKKMANEARKEMVYTEPLKYNPEAHKTYKKEADALDAHVALIEMNKPRERQAQIMANSRIEQIFKEDPTLDKEHKGKIRQQQITKARAALGVKRTTITLTDKEWEAIQAGAISENKLTKIINYADSDDLRRRATPKSMTTLSDSKISRLKTMGNSGKYTISQIAEQFGVSTATVRRYLNEEGSDK